MLARAGVPLTTTQKLMRHSDPRITAQYYIEVTEMDMGLALEKIPLK
jgi:integrase